MAYVFIALGFAFAGGIVGKLNATVNLEANKRWMDWTKRIRATMTSM